jgi:hypothetical protein
LRSDRLRYFINAVTRPSSSRKLARLTGTTSADPWEDESGKGRWRGEYRDDYRGHYALEYKEEFRGGDCKIERKWKRNG